MTRRIKNRGRKRGQRTQTISLRNRKVKKSAFQNRKVKKSKIDEQSNPTGQKHHLLSPFNLLPFLISRSRVNLSFYCFLASYSLYLYLSLSLSLSFSLFLCLLEREKGKRDERLEGLEAARIGVRKVKRCIFPFYQPIKL